MLEFILGRACTGKTHQIIKRLSDASALGRCVLIVPEQFSFESERAVIKYPNAYLENINVLSFSRLYDEIIEKRGKGSYPCVSDFEKIILIRKAINACKDNLKIFFKYIGHRDFSEKIADTIRDFKFAGTDADELMRASEQIGDICGAKLHDISVIMSAYEALLKDKYIDPSDRLTRLYQILTDYDYFRNTTVFFDSFTGFTGQQYKIIEKIFEQADKVVFSFCTDNPDDTSLGVFHNINFAVQKIKSMARSRNIEISNPQILNSNFYSNTSMHALEEAISYDAASLEKTSSNSNVRVISCDNRREEALAAANIISKEVYENGYRFRDFVLVSRNAEEYGNAVERQCKLNDIACFMDKSVSLTGTPLCVYILSLLEAAASSTTDNILTLLKTGLTDISTDEISELEDYTFIWNIKASDWHNPWVMSVNGLQTNEDNEYSKQRLESINKVREKVDKILLDFKKNFLGTPEKRAKAIFCHLTDNHIDINLSKLCDHFESEGDNYNASILKQSWDSIISVLDSIVRVLDDTEVSDDEFKDCFIIACSASLISNIPQMLDEVTFGAADRIRPSKPKISIIMGANQGVFPCVSTPNGLLAKSDKDKLIKFGIALDDDAIKGAIEENYLVYSMLCCPVDKVYVLYSKKSPSGETLEPSSFISKILGCFDEIKVADFHISSSGEFVPRTPMSAFAEIGSTEGKNFEEIKMSLKGHTEYDYKLHAMENAVNEPDFSISREASAGLFGKQLHISATKFDTYHKCALSYLLKNGLRIKKLQKADLNVLQRGTIAHYVLENIVSKYREKLSELSVLQISSEVDALIHKYISAVRGSEMLMTARFAYLLDKISQSVKQIVYHIAQEFAQSEFKPEYFELQIGKDGDLPRIEYALSDGSSAYFDGVIDRVDVYKDNVRVVDYKTGKMTFTLSDTLVGLNMQMLLYLYAFIKNGSELVESPKPAGILYMPAKASIDHKSLKMNGLISDDMEVRTAMEKDNKGVYVPKFSDKSDNYISPELFELIFKKIDELMLKMGDTVRQGKFEAAPTDGINIKACAYCDFSSICRSSDKPHKCAVEYSKDEIIEILKGGDSSGI